TGKNVDLVFVIDSSGSMSNEGATLAARIGDVMSRIVSESGGAIDSAQAGVISYTDSPTLVSSITDDATALDTAIQGIAPYTGSEEDGLQAMASVVNGGSLFNQIGWRANTVRSIVLLTDEDSDDQISEGDGFEGDAAGYSAFRAMLENLGYLNNVIVSDRSQKCSEFGGTGSNDGCEYIPTAIPSSGAFDLVDFTQNTDAFLAGFIKAKIGEIIITPPVDIVPLPAAGWLLIGGLGGLVAVKRRKKS
ncbi:MAG: VWA domain-containing protein, partial [Pseudomonadota bacterium]